jgi:hypothetical protein
MLRQISIFLLITAAATAGAQESQYSGEAQQQEEPAATSLGDVVRSGAMAKLQSATAGGQYEAARQQYMQNQARAVAAYFEMRRHQRQHQARERYSPLSTEHYVRQARDQAPERLRPSQLDSLTGNIRWPEALMKPAYATRRAEVQRLFIDLRADYPVASEIQKACSEFQNQIKADKGTLDANSFIVALQFLQSLNYEATTRSY